MLSFFFSKQLSHGKILLFAYFADFLHKSKMNEVIMSILNVEHLNHGFGDRAILR